MKKLLVILMLGAGFVTVAAADQLNCNNTSTNQCCDDIGYMYDAAADNGGVIPAMDGDSVTWLSAQLTKDGTSDSLCATTAHYTSSDETHHRGTCQWQPGDWRPSLDCY